MTLKSKYFLLTILLIGSMGIFGNAQAAENCSDEYFVEQTMENGAKWEFCWEHRNREGIIYHDVYYTPNNADRYKVLAEAAIAQIFVPYDDNGARFHDVSDFGLGDNNMLALDNNNCPDGQLLQFDSKNVLCQQNIDVEDVYSGNGEYRRTKALSVFSVSAVGSYNYIPQYLFHDDGTIEPSMGATGRLERTGGNPDHGWLIRDQVYGISHLHHYYWRLDFDLGDSADDDVAQEINFDGVATRTHVIEDFSDEVARSLSPETMRRWRVIDKGRTNANNEFSGYEINMQNTGHRDVGPANEPWTFDDFYVTRTKTCEMYASHNPTIDGCANNLAAFVNNESTANQDITVWVGITFHHVPRAEDDPRMHAHWNAMQLIPYNLHSNTPSYTGSTTPVLTMSAVVDQNDEEGETASLTLQATNSNGRVLTYSTNALPPGLSLDSATGVISGTITTNSAGNYFITATVSDGSQQTSQSFDWTVTPANQTEICGDGVIDTGEQCDDGNTVSGDFCSATCQTEICGNGIVDANESCDDANIFSGDGCSASCQVEPPSGPSCGNSIIETGESCDDGNANSGDGCSANCQQETVSACPNTLFPLIGRMWSADIQYISNSCSPNGNTCATYVGDPVNAHATPIVCVNNEWQVSSGGTPVCGNSSVETGEACDDGNNTNGDGCNLLCQIEVPTEPQCGNNVTESGESCDDGNLSNGDGCNASCQIELPTQPSCGNNVIETGESCDDGNNIDDDGCSASCQQETASACPNTLFPLIGTMWSADIQYVNNSCSPNGNACATYVSDPVNTHATPIVCINNAWQVYDGSAAVCGNGSIESGETCDDGNLSNGDGCSAACLSEAPSNSTPRIIETGDQSNEAGASISLAISATDVDGDILDFSATGLPLGLGINSSTGLISGTLSNGASGNNNVTITVNDGTNSASTSFFWSVTGQSETSVIYYESFESNDGWVTNAGNTDTATTGFWQSAFPETTSFNDEGPYQPGSVTHGNLAMVTAGAAGASAGAFDIDSGDTTVVSPMISLPNANSITLDFDYYFSLRVNATNDDYFRVVVVTAAGANTIYEQLGSATDVPASWLHVTRDLSAFANQSIQLRIEAADAGQPSLIEAGVDAISITGN